MSRKHTADTAPFKVGDTVSLKSGGPEMTVVKIDLNHDATQWVVVTTWFAGKKIERGSFPPAALVLARTADDDGE